MYLTLVPHDGHATWTHVHESFPMKISTNFMFCIQITFLICWPPIYLQFESRWFFSVVVWIFSLHLVELTQIAIHCIHNIRKIWITSLNVYHINILESKPLFWEKHTKSMLFNINSIKNRHSKTLYVVYLGTHLLCYPVPRKIIQPLPDQVASMIAQLRHL